MNILRTIYQIEKARYKIWIFHTRQMLYAQALVPAASTTTGRENLAPLREGQVDVCLYHAQPWDLVVGVGIDQNTARNLISGTGVGRG